MRWATLSLHAMRTAEVAETVRSRCVWTFRCQPREAVRFCLVRQNKPPIYSFHQICKQQQQKHNATEHV